LTFLLSMRSSVCINRTGRTVIPVADAEMRSEDTVEKAIVKLISASKAPLETKEVHQGVVQELGDVSRTKVLYRLNDLRGDGTIKGKSVGSGKGVWIWWKEE